MLPNVLVRTSLFFLFSLFLFVQCSRVSHTLRFLSNNIGSEPGSTQLKLHSAYHGVETLNVLSKYPGYVQANLLSPSDFTYKVATFTSSLQNGGTDLDAGGFQSVADEKEQFETKDGFVSTVSNSFFVGNVLEICEGTLGGGEIYFKRIDAVAAVKFLENTRFGGLYSSFPGSEVVTVSTNYYGTLAWKLFMRHAEVPSAKGVETAKIEEFLWKMYVEGGFKNSEKAQEPDLQTTYQAITLLQEMTSRGKFENEAKQIKKYVLSQKNDDGNFGDVAKTYFAVAILDLLSAVEDLDKDAITQFVLGLQTLEDGGFKLNKGSSSGHHVNTYYAIKTLHKLRTVESLESDFHTPKRIILEPQHIPNMAFTVMIIVALVLFAGLLFLFTSGGGEEEEEEEEGEEETKPKYKDLKKPRKRPTIKILRHKVTKQCVDVDGEPFNIAELDAREWDKQVGEDEGEYTVYFLTKKEKPLSVRTSSSRRSNRK